MKYFQLYFIHGRRNGVILTPAASRWQQVPHIGTACSATVRGFILELGRADGIPDFRSRSIAFSGKPVRYCAKRADFPGVTANCSCARFTPY